MIMVGLVCYCVVWVYRFGVCCLLDTLGFGVCA